MTARNIERFTIGALVLLGAFASAYGSVARFKHLLTVDGAKESSDFRSESL